MSSATWGGRREDAARVWPATCHLTRATCGAQSARHETSPPAASRPRFCADRRRGRSRAHRQDPAPRSRARRHPPAGCGGGESGAGFSLVGGAGLEGRSGPFFRRAGKHDLPMDAGRKRRARLSQAERRHGVHAGVPRAGLERTGARPGKPAPALPARDAARGADRERRHADLARGSLRGQALQQPERPRARQERRHFFHRSAVRSRGWQQVTDQGAGVQRGLPPVRREGDAPHG